MALAVGLTACGQASDQPVGPPRWTTAACPHPAANVVAIGEPPGQHAIPKNFHPAWVLRCLITSRSVPVTQRADLTPAMARDLVRSLSQPSETPSDCRQDSAKHTVIVPYFALVDASGRALLPGLPSDRCGRPLPAADRAVSSLPYVRVVTSR